MVVCALRGTLSVLRSMDSTPGTRDLSRIRVRDAHRDIAEEICQDTLLSYICRRQSLRKCMFHA